MLRITYILFFIFFQTFLLGQTNTPTPTYLKVPQASNQQDSIVLISNFVNLRQGANIDSPIVANLPIHTPLQYLGRKHVIKQTGEHNQSWVHVATKQDSGYIHSSLVMFPKHILQSASDSSLFFIISENKIVAKQNDSIIYNYANPIVNPYEISSTYNNSSGLETINLTFIGEYCGGFNGSSYVCWDGINLFSCGSDGYMGDGSGNESYSSKMYIDPDNQFIYIYEYTYFYEALTTNLSRINLSNSIEFHTHTSTEVFVYDGKERKPIKEYPALPIPDSPLKSLINKEFNRNTLPTHSLQIDINNDGYRDVFFIHEGVYFALADSTGSLTIISENIALNDNIKYASIEKFKSGIALNIIKRNSEEDRHLRRIEFVFDNTLNQLIVKRTVDAIFKEVEYYYEVDWSEVQNFKTKKLTLNEIW